MTCAQRQPTPTSPLSPFLFSVCPGNSQLPTFDRRPHFSARSRLSAVSFELSPFFSLSRTKTPQVLYLPLLRISTGGTPSFTRSTLRQIATSSISYPFNLNYLRIPLPATPLFSHPSKTPGGTSHRPFLNFSLRRAKSTVSTTTCTCRG